jgi:hypothetical protein
VVSHEHIFGGPLPGQVEKWCINCFLSKREIEEGFADMNLYDDKREQIGEVNFQMGGAVVTFKEGNKNRPEGEVERKLVIPNHIFDAIKRLGSGVVVIPDETEQSFDVSRLRSENKSLGVHLEELKKRNQELTEAVTSLRRQRDVRTKMLNAVLHDELEDHG